MEKERRYEVLTLSRSGEIIEREEYERSQAARRYEAKVADLRSFDDWMKFVSDTAYVVYRETVITEDGNPIVYEERKSYVL